MLRRQIASQTTLTGRVAPRLMAHVDNENEILYNNQEILSPSMSQQLPPTHTNQEILSPSMSQQLPPTHTNQEILPPSMSQQLPLIHTDGALDELTKNDGGSGDVSGGHSSHCVLTASNSSIHISPVEIPMLKKKVSHPKKVFREDGDPVKRLRYYRNFEAKFSTEEFHHFKTSPLVRGHLQEKIKYNIIANDRIHALIHFKSQVDAPSLEIAIFGKETFALQKTSHQIRTLLTKNLFPLTESEVTYSSEGESENEKEKQKLRPDILREWQHYEECSSDTGNHPKIALLRDMQAKAESEKKRKQAFEDANSTKRKRTKLQELSENGLKIFCQISQPVFNFVGKRAKSFGQWMSNPQ